MAKKKLTQHHGRHTEGPFQAVKDETQARPWRVMAHKRLVAEVRSRPGRADAERIAACLNALEGIPTQDVVDGAVARMWVSLRQLADLAEGTHPPPPPGREAQLKRTALATAREALALVGQGRQAPSGGKRRGVK